ncbi:hypothetical protein [Crucivirus-458]|nr:hypothetical protein [Crucivirus-458]
MFRVPRARGGTTSTRVHINTRHSRRTRTTLPIMGVALKTGCTAKAGIIFSKLLSSFSPSSRSRGTRSRASMSCATALLLLCTTNTRGGRKIVPGVTTPPLRHA